ncbi:MAG: hypothetical protein EF813_03150 [Methanosarcinales archaeon]|nr:MAG: hypothetical protein EF813_03150 [Methanosarcinales archaeon]
MLAAKKGLDIRSRRLRILSGVNIQMNFREYYASLQVMIRNCPFITHWGTELEEIDLQVGYLKGMLEFVDGSTLHHIQTFGELK